MVPRLAADLVLLVHTAFIAFVVLGGLLVLWRRWIVWLHLPAAVWGFVVEFTGRLCPLTDWENALRRAAGDAGYRESFVEHYLLPLVYPAGLTREVQFVLAAAVVGVNLVVYAWVIRRAARRTR